MPEAPRDVMIQSTGERAEHSHDSLRHPVPEQALLSHILCMGTGYRYLYGNNDR